MFKRIASSSLLATVGLATAVGCASPYGEPIVEDAVIPVQETRQAISQEDLEEVYEERVVGFWGEPGFLVRIGDDEFVVHTPADGKVVARKRVDGQIVSVSVSPDGEKACMIYRSRSQGLQMALYDTQEDKIRWHSGLRGTPYMVVAGVDHCLVGYEGDQHPEVFEAADGKARVRLMQTPEEPMGVFTSRDGFRQWWVSPVDDLQLEAGDEPGTRWHVTQVEIRSWTFEGHVVARCLEADASQIRAVVHRDEDNPAVAEMARRAQMGYGAGACEAAGPYERMRFSDGVHRLARSMDTYGEPAEANEELAEADLDESEERAVPGPRRDRTDFTAEEQNELAEAAQDQLDSARDGAERSVQRTGQRARRQAEEEVRGRSTVIRDAERVIRRMPNPVEGY